MKWNQLEGSMKDVAGKVPQRVGEVTGNTKRQAKGVAKRVEGKVQRSMGDVKQSVKTSANT